MIPFKTRIKSGVVQSLEVLDSLTFQGVPLTPGASTDERAKVSSNDTTAGFLNGKLVAGTGITFTENNNGGNETLSITLGSHVHAATDITSGVMATARLGSGTANGTTFLAGDQTYKTAVTSVNGSTGEVTVAGGDTTYSFTVNDAENTSSLITVLRFVIPGNTMADGEKIEIDWWFEVNNGNGTTPTLTTQVQLNGTNANTATDTVGSNSSRSRYYKLFLLRRGSNLFVPRVNTGGTTDYLPTSTGNIWSSSSNGMANTSNYTSLSPTFSNDNIITITMQWSAANTTSWVRTYSVRAVKQTGQQT